MIKAENLVKEFTRSEKQGKKTVKTGFNAVDGISLEAYDGETLGIIGPNGAGKTTLLRMLSTIMDPTSGTVTHFDRSGNAISNKEEIKASMGYLSNNTKLYSKFTVREFLSILGSIYGFTKKETETRIEETAKALVLDSFIDNNIGKLSTGQTQRANLARCLFPDPDFYILDEPTLGLDVMSAASIVDFMRSESQKGKTIIYSTHYLEEAESLCTRVVLLNRGKIIDSGAPKDLCSKYGTSSLRETFLQLIREEDTVK